MTSDAVARLRRLDACAVSDASDRLGLRDRVALACRPVTGRTRVAGRVITVELGPPQAGAATRHLCAAATDSATADDVIVIAHQGRTDCAGWGGNLARAARRRGAAGTLIDGATRDVDEAADIGYVVYATAATPVTARGRAEEHAWGGAIEFEGIRVEHGDYVLADSSGVVFVRAGEIEAVLETAEGIAAKEAAMAAAIEAGEAVSDVMGADYENMLR